jgi:hypothetical protein
MQGLRKKNEKKLSRSFNFMFRYRDNVVLLSNSRLSGFVDRIELEIKDITDTNTCASYIDLHLEIDSEGAVKNEILRQKR